MSLLLAALAAAAVSVAPPSSVHPSRAQVLAAVQAEWSHYDVGNKGRLTPLEFSTWVIKANGATVAQTGAVHAGRSIRPVPAMNVTSNAFARADANHDGGVTPDEMVAFLMR